MSVLDFRVRDLNISNHRRPSNVVFTEIFKLKMLELGRFEFMMFVSILRKVSMVYIHCSWGAAFSNDLMCCTCNPMIAGSIPVRSKSTLLHQPI